LLYGTSGILDTSLAPLKAGKAKVCREGEDVTIITFSHMVSVALEAAEELEQKGIDAEVIDLRTIRPLDLETLGESACKTQRVIIAEEGTYTGGVGAEIAAKISEECFGYLDAPILRVAAKDSIIPTSRILEESILPNKVDIIGAVSKIIDES
jgi:pyruvate/2-oxoglutarate/acetoin dehydrogenase E1 component